MSQNKFEKTVYHKSVYKAEELESAIAEVAMVGRSNVGKSSTLNAVCGKSLANTSQNPGRTRTINVFAVEKGKWIVDLPGYGFASRSEEEIQRFKHMIKSYLASRPSVRLALLIVDAEVGPTKLDQEMALWLERHDVPFIVIANKCDKVKSSKQREAREAVAQKLAVDLEDIRWVSAEKKLGMGALATEVAQVLELI